jgi:hypothetical protein
MKTGNYERTPINQETMQFIRFVWACLGETDTYPQDTIKKVVCILGTDCVKALLQETLQVEQSGGMLTADQSRRRSPGGVFLYLCKKHHKKQLGSVFPWKERVQLGSEVQS